MDESTGETIEASPCIPKGGSVPAHKASLRQISSIFYKIIYCKSFSNARPQKYAQRKTQRSSLRYFAPCLAFFALLKKVQCCF